MKKIFLVDVSSLFFRAFYAIRPLSSSTGTPVNAIYGLLTMTFKLLKEERPEYIAFCFDRKEPSFRKDLYQDYKANRSEMPEDLVPQIPYIKKMTDALGIPSFELAGFEADDLIGTITQHCRSQNYQVYIVSGDKDFGQLVDDHVFLVDTMKDQKISTQGVIEKWGIRPDQFIDYLALVGDSSDHVPGVAGIGPKGAQKLLTDFQTLDGIYQNLDQIKGALKEKLEKSKEMAYLSKKLVTIVTDTPLQMCESDLRWKGLQTDLLNPLLEELNFKNFGKTIDSLNSGQSEKVASNPISGSTVSATPIPTAVSVSEKVDVSHLQLMTATAQLLEERIPVEATVTLFMSDTVTWMGYENSIFKFEGDLEALVAGMDRKKLKYSGFDLKSVWKNLGLKAPRIEWDSQLAAYFLKPGESLEFRRVFTQTTGELVSDLQTPEEDYYRLQKLEAQLRAKISERGGLNLLTEVDFPLSPILYKMESLGFRIDVDLLREQSRSLQKDLEQLEQSIHSLAGRSFNIGSPKQLAQILFEEMKLPPSKKTKTGYSTDNDVLEKLKPEHPIAEQLISYRELAKLKSTYVDAFPLLVKEDGRIHSHFHQALTTTGRLSSTEPNLQNIPIRTPRGAAIRKAFVAAHGEELLSLDYSQIELRILAHFSGDKNLCKAFEQDQDIHQATASEVFGVDLAAVTADQRRTAKAINFGIAYGQGAFGLAETLGISRSESSEIIKRYFQRFPGVKEYIDQTIQSARSKSYVETLSGRRRYIDELLSKNVAIQKFGERAAINAPIQGTASDIVKMAMIKCAELYKEESRLKLILQVHDELIFEGPKEILLANVTSIKKLMETVMTLNVPLKVNAHLGINWDEAH